MGGWKRLCSYLVTGFLVFPGNGKWQIPHRPGPGSARINENTGPPDLPEYLIGNGFLKLYIICLFVFLYIDVLYACVSV